MNDISVQDLAYTKFKFFTTRVFSAKDQQVLNKMWESHKCHSQPNVISTKRHGPIKWMSCPSLEYQ